MSAVGFALRVFPHTHQLVETIRELMRLPGDAPGWSRDMLRDRFARYTADLAAKVQEQDTATLRDAIGAATLDTRTIEPEVVWAVAEADSPAFAGALPLLGGGSLTIGPPTRSADPRSDPGYVFAEGVVTMLARVEPEIDAVVRAVLERAAARMPIPDVGTLLGASRKGRPRTPPPVVARARELKGDNVTYKEIAKHVNAEFDTSYTAQAIRDLLRPRRQDR